MSVLSNKRHEHFAHLIAKGVNATEAYVQAGYSKNGAAGAASKLQKSAKVCKRIAEIKANIVAVAVEKSGVCLADVLSELKALVHADPRKVFSENGDLLPVSEWPDEVAAMVASVEIEALFDGQGKDRKQIGYTKKIKFWDKNSAIDKAMKHLGAFEADNKQRSGLFDSIPRDQLNEIERKLRELAGLAEQPNTQPGSRFTH